MATGTIPKIIYKDYGNAATSLSAGTIGTYATAPNTSVAVTGRKPIGAVLIAYGHPGYYHCTPVLDIDGNTLHFVFYRASSSAYSVTADDVKVRVFYE